MKLLVIGPKQSGQLAGEAGQERAALQAAQVDSYIVMTPREGEGKMAAALRFLRESKQAEFDVVSAQDPFFVGLVAWRIARRCGARFNAQVHADLAAQSPVRHVLAQIVLRHADSVRVVSEKIKRQAERMGARAKITVLPMYTDISRFSSLERHPERMVLWVGRFEPEKDPMLALDIVKNIPGAKLVMLGEGSLKKELIARSNGLSVELPGWQDPLPHLKRAGVFLNTSPAESYGVAIIEALAAGVPVVSMDVGIAKEAGATVVPKAELGAAVAEALTEDKRGELRLKLHSKEEWIKIWRESL